MFKIAREADINGNLFEAPQELKVVTINTVGAMGRGIALYVKDNYPEAHKEYMKRHHAGVLSHTEVWDIRLDNDVNIAMFPTKIHWRSPSPPGVIEYNIKELQQLIFRNNYKSVAIPPLGMVNGWIRNDNVIKEIVLNLRLAFKDTEIDAVLYCPDTMYNKMKGLFRVT